MIPYTENEEFGTAILGSLWGREATKEEREDRRI